MHKQSSFVRLLHSESGTTLVESTFAIPFLLLVMLVGMDLIRAGFNYVSLQYVAEQTIRKAAIATSSGTDVQSYFAQEAAKYGLKVTAANMGLCPKNLAPCYGQANTGNSDDMLRLDITLPIDGFLLGNKLLMSKFQMNLVASSTTRRENPA